MVGGGMGGGAGAGNFGGTAWIDFAQQLYGAPGRVNGNDGDYTTSYLPNINGRPLGVIPKKAKNRNFLEQLLAGGKHKGGVDDEVLGLIGRAIGTYYGGSQGGQIGADAGFHMGSLF